MRCRSICRRRTKSIVVTVTVTVTLAQRPIANGFSSHCHFHSVIHPHLVHVRHAVSVKKPPLVIAAWHALNRHSKSPHSFSFLVFSLLVRKLLLLLLVPRSRLVTVIATVINK